MSAEEPLPEKNVRTYINFALGSDTGSRAGSEQLDLLEQLGPLAFASRLRRLADRLHRDVSQIYREMEIEFEARWFPVLYALQEGQSRAITGLANALGLTHPAINQIVGAMAKRGLVRSRKDRKDERRRLIALTAAGERLVEKLQPIWQEISAATGEVISPGSNDLLKDVEQLEKILDQESMYERVSHRLKLRRAAEIEVIDYKPAFKKHFETLNREWLEEYFSVEAEDAAILGDPHGLIIKSGGAVLFARRQGKVVGTVALLRHNSGIIELTKMAVTSAQRGSGAGRRLGEAAIEKARQLGAGELILLTSKYLEAAVSLYRSLGFRNCEVPPELVGKLERCSIAMKLKLD